MNKNIHPCACECDQCQEDEREAREHCRLVAAAITATTADGSYFFTEDELFALFGHDHQPTPAQVQEGVKE